MVTPYSTRDVAGSFVVHVTVADEEVRLATNTLEIVTGEGGGGGGGPLLATVTITGIEVP